MNALHSKKKGQDCDDCTLRRQILAQYFACARNTAPCFTLANSLAYREHVHVAYTLSFTLCACTHCLHASSCISCECHARCGVPSPMRTQTRCFKLPLHVFQGRHHFSLLRLGCPAAPWRTAPLLTSQGNTTQCNTWPFPSQGNAAHCNTRTVPIAGCVYPMQALGCAHAVGQEHDAVGFLVPALQEGGNIFLFCWRHCALPCLRRDREIVRTFHMRRDSHRRVPT